MKRLVTICLIMALVVFYFTPLNTRADSINLYTYHVAFRLNLSAPLIARTQLAFNFDLGKLFNFGTDDTPVSIYQLQDTYITSVEFTSIDTYLISPDGSLARPSFAEVAVSATWAVYGQGYRTLPYSDPVGVLAIPASGQPFPSPKFYYDKFYTPSSGFLDFYTGYQVFNAGVLAVTFTSRAPLDLSHLEGIISSGLLSISTSLDGVKSTLDNFRTITQNGFNTVNTNLLSIVSAINNLSNSGGTSQAATVAAINALNGTAGKIFTEQSVSADRIIANASSNTSDIVQNATDNKNAITAAQGLTTSAVNAVTDELRREADASEAAVDSRGNEVTGMVTSLLSDTEDRWGVLKLPVEFTTQIFTVFTGGSSSAAYSRAYSDVVGYRYDDDTGILIPISSRTRAVGDIAIGEAVTGTIIHFPSFSLNLPGYGNLKIWDGYDFDLQQTKNDFPIIFNAIYLVSGILMIYWTVAYLIDLFNDLISH